MTSDETKRRGKGKDPGYQRCRHPRLAQIRLNRIGKSIDACAGSRTRATSVSARPSPVLVENPRDSRVESAICDRDPHFKLDLRQNRCWPSHQAQAAISADAGIVRTQAIRTLPATPQCTARVRRVEPTPMIAPVIVCVVETGMPKPDARKSDIAPPVSAANPPTGFSFVIRWPIVLTMRQPPNRVPNAIAA